MTEQEIFLKRERRVGRGSGLRVRMTFSYILVSVAAALVAETLVLGIVFVLLTHFALAGESHLTQARLAARWYALSAAVQANGTALNPHTTFIADQPASIALPPGVADTSVSDSEQYFALLIAPNGRVLASTDPVRHPLATPVVQLLPQQSQFIEHALAGKSAEPLIDSTAQGHMARIVETVWTRTKQPMGAIYVQVPLDLSGARISPSLIWGWLISALLFLVITIPLGAFFGAMTTRGLVQRLQQLVLATTRFAHGDYAPRVSIKRPDEVGQLEAHFNQMAEQLVESMAQRQTLGEQNARLAERARIARELHDAISQNLFSLRMLAGGLQASTSGDSPLMPQIVTMQQTTTTIIREMRALLLELRPAQLEDLGLVEAIEDLAAAYRARLGISVMTSLTPVPLSSQAEHALLRIAQEALSNAARHADATTITLELFSQDETILFLLTDNGTGFTGATSSKQHGLGLHLMQERIQELHGTFMLETAPGQGTRIRICLPGEQHTPTETGERT